METALYLKTAVVGAVMLLICGSPMGARAQVTGFDPEYDDEEAAGAAQYSDVEAAGAVELASEAEVGEQGDDEQESPAESSDDELFRWEVGAKQEGENEAKGDDVPSWEWGGERHHSNMMGPTGLLHITEAGSDKQGTFGVGIHGAFFSHTDYLYYGDKNNQMWGGIKLRVTPLEFLEIFGALESSANYNNKVRPELFQALGDFKLGVKGFHEITDWYSIGGMFRLEFMNPVGDVSFSFAGTSVGLDLLNTIDISELAPDVPLRLHLALGYFFDNASNLIEDIEETRGGCGTDVDGDGKVDYRGCLNPVERTALSIDRNDQFRIGIGADVALPYVSPILEYQIEIPVNRQDFVCPRSVPGSPDSCMDQEGGGGYRQFVTLGARILPPMESLAIDLGVDIGVSGYAPSVHELAAEVPYRIIFGLTYNFDPFKEPVVQQAPPPPAPVAPEPVPPPAVIAGLVHDVASEMTPVPGARITYVGQDLNPQVGNQDGSFRSYPLAAGMVTVNVSAEGYKDGSFAVEVPETGEVALKCPLEAEVKKAEVLIRIKDEDGKPVGMADIKMKGPEPMNVSTDASGEFASELTDGNYRILIEKEGYLKKVTSFEARQGTRVEMEIQLRSKPERQSVVVGRKRIVIRKKIHFETNSDQIKSDSFALMDEIADVILSNAQLKLIEIQGHTDNRGAPAYNEDLSERRAAAVRQYLVDSGVAASRLQSKGYGDKRPVAPNITATGRARNRRVEFHILEQDAAD
jgi:outer membrane protein OmpA-like peptidoglycan-associated protein